MVTLRLVDEAIGGWKFSVISSFQGGLPFTIAANDKGTNNTYSERANLNPRAPKCPKSLPQWFGFDNTPGSTDATFTQPALGILWRLVTQRNARPGQINADLSLSKRFTIMEKAGLELRFDAFNAFNHWNPGQPDDTMTDATVGDILPNNTQGSARILQLSGRFTF